jgi:hypothetical protein
MIHSKRALALGVLGFVSCQIPAPHEEPVGPVAEVSSASPICEAHASLDEMDTRVAVPLLPMMANQQKQNMRDHLLAVQEIILASGRNDFADVERAATRIGYSAEMGQMCTHMGAGAKGFTEQALAFHHTADSIAVAAREHDRPAVMAALGTTLQACTACHETFRQRVVDQATWTRLTSMPAPTGHHLGG